MQPADWTGASSDGGILARRERFLAYVEQFLVATLKPNDVVVLDNLGSHKGKAVRAAVRAAGARLLFLAKHSPDLNPIEQLFSKIKALVRKAAPRSLEAVSNAIANASTLVPQPSAPPASEIQAMRATKQGML